MKKVFAVLAAVFFLLNIALTVTLIRCISTANSLREELEDMTDKREASPDISGIVSGDADDGEGNDGEEFEFTSTGVISISGDIPQEYYVKSTMEPTEKYYEFIGEIREAMTGDDILEEILTEAEWDISVKELRSRISVKPSGEEVNNVLLVSVSDDNAYRAGYILGLLMQRVEHAISDKMGLYAKVIDYGRVPVH